MNKKTLLLAAAVIMLGTSCEKRIVADDQPGGNAVDVTAKLPDGRIWNDGDQITINNRKYTITEGVGSSDALFSGVAGSDTYAAAYDFGLGKIENNILTMSLPSGQGGDIVHSHPLAAHSTSPELDFIPLTGNLEIPVTGSAKITKIEISATEGDKLTGNVTVDLAFRDKPTVEFAETASPMLALNTGSTQLPARFSVNMIAADYKNLQLMVFDSEGNIMSHTIPALTITGGQTVSAASFEFKNDGPAPAMLNVSCENDAFGQTVAWSTDAQINVNGIATALREGGNTGTGTFGPVVNADEYYVMAPASSCTGFGGTIFNVNLPTRLSFNSNISLACPRAGKADSGNNVNLEYVAGIVKVTVSGNHVLRSATLQSNNDELIAGNGIIAIGNDGAKLRMRAGASESITMESNAGANISTGKELYFVVPEGNYSKGFTLQMTDSRNLTFSKVLNASDVTCNGITDLGSIVWEASEADNNNLSIFGYANCYMVAARGTYYFETRLYDGTPVNGISKADWLWATKLNGSNSQELISDIKYSDGKISFTASDKEGNVLIAAFNGAGEIVWSWHIWLTDIPEVVNYFNFNKLGEGFYFQDRNLGAVSGEINGDPKETYGLLYQFGRKDPFFGGVGNETKETVFSNAEQQTVRNTQYSQATWQSKMGTKEQGTMAFATANPMFFLAGNETDNGNMSWLNDEEWPLYPSSDSGTWKPLEKTIYDPCPPGYRVPRKGAWNGFIYKTNTEWVGKGTTAQGMIFTNEEGTQTWYPAQGYRSAHSQEMGALIYEGNGDREYGQVCLWQSEIVAKVQCSSASVVWPVISKEDMMAAAYGNSVRCVREYEYK